MLKTVTLVAILASLAGAASAQDSAPSPLGKLYSCSALSEPAERLACFDSEVANLKSREDSRDLVAIDSETAREIQKDSFGFRLPSLPKLALPRLGGGKEDAVELPIKSVASTGRNGVFVMENGQVWQQIDNDRKRIPKSKTGSAPIAHIRSASFGSYLMSVEVDGKMRAKGMRVRRVQ